MVSRTTKTAVSILIGGPDTLTIGKIAETLTHAGHQVCLASGPTEILTQISNQKPKLALIHSRLMDQGESELSNRVHRELDSSGAFVVRLIDESPDDLRSQHQNGVLSEGAESLFIGSDHADILGRVECFIRIQRAEENVRRQAERLEAIAKTQQEIASVKPDANTIMDLAAEEAQRLTHGDGAAIEMVMGDSLVAEAASGSLAHLKGHRNTITTSTSQHCILTDEVLCSNDIETDTRFKSEDIREKGSRSMLIVPLRYQYNSIGVLKVVADRASAFQSEDEQALHFVACFMADAINQAVAFGAKQALLAEHTRTIVALRESEERFRSAFDQAAIGMALVRTDGRWMKVNRTLCESVGYSEQEFRSLDFHSLTHPEDLNLHMRNVQELLSGEVGSFQVEERYFHKSGSLLWLLLHVSLLRSSTGKPLHFIAQIQDITERKRAEEALVMQAKVLQNMSEGVCLTDHSGLIIYTNRAEDQIFGYKTGELRGLHISKLIRDSTKAKHATIEEIIKHVTTVGSWTGEFNSRGKDGRTFTTATNISLLEAATNKHLVCVQEDISEKKLSDERIRNSLKEKEVLLKEIHHRVKNNLQIISSLLNLQSGYTQNKDDTERFRESQNRVRSMALIHEKLYQSQDLARVDINEYVESLSAMLFRSYGTNSGDVKLELRIDPVQLNIDIAVPVGLLLNELVSNSLKHAFPDSRPGTITVEFRSHPKTGFNLSFHDDGVGFPEKFDLDKSTSLGLRLVKILTSQIGGTLTLRRNGGTEFSVRFG